MMVLLHPCIPCQDGDHDHCQGGRAAPEGMLGGWECSCRHCERQRAVASREQQPTSASTASEAARSLHSPDLTKEDA